MKRFFFLLLTSVTSLLWVGCRDSKPINDIELYGNTFIKLDNEEFQVPDNWITYYLFDSAFQIKLPPLMQERSHYPLTDGYANIIFMHDRAINVNEYHYGRVGIDYYYHSSGDFNKANDYIHYSDQERILSPFVKQALRGGTKLFDGNSTFVTPNAKLINGPFYEPLHMFDGKTFYAYDAFYRREGNFKDTGPVSCHIFLLMNKTESVYITVSHYDKDSVLFDNLFNVVKTFRWTKIND